MARNLNARAEVYDAIAAEIAKAGVVTAGELAHSTGADAVRATTDPLRNLSTLEPADIVRVLWTDDRALRGAVVAHARRNIPAQVEAALLVPELADRWHTALQAEISRRSSPPPGQGTLRRLERDALIQVREELRASGTPLKGQSDTIVQQLSTLGPDSLARRLLTHREDLLQVALADARRRTPQHVAAVLRRSDVLPAFISALEHLQYNLDRQVEARRADGRHPRDKAWEDRRRVIARLREIRAHHAGTRVDRREYTAEKFNSWEQSVITMHKAEIKERHAAAVAERGLAFPLNIPKSGVVAFAMEHGILAPPPEPVERLLRLADDQLRAHVADDVNNRCPQPLLRTDWLLDRWRVALVTLKEVSEARRTEAEDDTIRSRRTRFVQAINTSLSEQKRLLLALRDKVHAEVDRRDTAKADRWELWDAICRDVITRYRREELYGASVASGTNESVASHSEGPATTTHV
jgi:hypothetical protein